MPGSWETVAIAGKPADVYHLATRARPRFGILDLHGVDLDTLWDRPAFTRWFDEFEMVCVCPHGGRSWWADRVCAEFDPQLTPEHFLLDHVLPYFSSRWSLPPRAVGLQGISMGGQGALRLAFKHPGLFPVVAAISAAIEYHELYGQGTAIDNLYDSKEQCRQDTVLLHVHPAHYPPHIFFAIDPDDNRWYRGNDRLDEKLNALGVAHETDLLTRAGGHSWQYFEHMAERVERFVQAGLLQESRRLL